LQGQSASQRGGERRGMVAGLHQGVAVTAADLLGVLGLAASSTSSPGASAAGVGLLWTQRSRRSARGSPLRRGRDADVSAHAREALDLFDKMQMPFWKAVTRLEYGTWLTTQGRTMEADDMRAQAASTFADLGVAPWLERVNSSSRGQPSQPEAGTAMPA
jgi:hypothetical protein